MTDRKICGIIQLTVKEARMRGLEDKMTYLRIEAARECYSAKDALEGWNCRETMTVGDLRRFLEDYDDDTKIIFSHDGGYTFGSLTENDISEEDTEDEEEEE